MFERTDEDLIIVAIVSTTLSQATAYNVTMLSEKISQEELDKNKLKDEVINLRVEMHKRRKVEDETTPLRATIMV